MTPLSFHRESGDQRSQVHSAPRVPCDRKNSHYAASVSRGIGALGLPSYKPGFGIWLPAATVNFRRCVELFGGSENIEAKANPHCSLNRCTCFHFVGVDKLRVLAVVWPAIRDATVNEVVPLVAHWRCKPRYRQRLPAVQR